MLTPDEKQLDDLFLRAKTVLGSENWNLTFTQPRKSAFLTGIKLAVEANDNQPSKVTDLQIQGAFETALTVWPIEAEVLSKAFLSEMD
jgi:hypothetical protein